MVTYFNDGLKLGDSGSTVSDLQEDLRALGYLGSGIDGQFGDGTARAVRALKLDLRDNHGNGKDGKAPVAVSGYATGPITDLSPVVDPGLAASIAAMLAAPGFPKLPKSTDPASDNAAAITTLQSIRSTRAPLPFLLAMARQESGRRHFSVPKAGGRDSYIVVGLDRNDPEAPDRITSRGYGIGQYTLFHHPPRPDEVAAFLLDPVANVHRAIDELADKFGNWVVGPADHADDRKVEHPELSLRRCRYAASDARYMSDCVACAKAARKVTIRDGVPVYDRASVVYHATAYYPGADYGQIPDRADFGCDWPYAARRYNGSGINSFHYQARILRNLETAT